MLFNSIPYLLFFPVVFALYWCLSIALPVGFFALCLMPFRATNLQDTVNALNAMFSLKNGNVLHECLTESTVGTAPLNYGCYADAFCLPRYTFHGTSPFGHLAHLYNWISRMDPVWRISIYCGVLLTVVGFSPSQPSPFIYFQF